MKSDITQRQLISAARSFGMVIEWNGDENEYAVNFKGGSVDTIYYTDNRDDALDTAIEMRLSKADGPIWGAVAMDMKETLAKVRANGLPTGYAL